MIYIMLLNEKQNELQQKIIKYLKLSLFNNNIQYKFIFNNKHIIENDIKHIQYEDYIIFHPELASNNLYLVKKYLNSIVILNHKTVLLQKLSKRNPINENLAINNNFKILYIEPDYDDITNLEYKLIVKEEDYLIKIETIVKNNQT